jgi:Ca-activated chloride channel family protein
MQALNFMWPYAAFLVLLIIPLAYRFKHDDDQGALRTNLVHVILPLVLGKNKSLSRPSIIFISIWFLLTLALMRPHFVGKPLEISRSGRNIFLTVDISESMEAKDLAQGQSLDRLSIAKQVLVDFIDSRHGDRLALVLFASESFLHAPLSFDRPMIKRFLLEAHIGFLGPKTAIGDAIGLSVKKLSEQPKNQERIMILLTDGQNNTGVLQPMQAAKFAQEHGVKIYIVGLGASRMNVDGFFGPQVINPSEDLEHAEPELRAIAALSGGAYFRAQDQKALSAIYDSINKLEPTIIDKHPIIPKKELFYWPLALALVLMLAHALFLTKKGLYSC